jgi:hypothetical protein
LPLALLLSKVIFPFSPGKVANAEGWFESSGGDGDDDDGNIVKMLDDTKMAINPITTSRKPYGIVVLFANSGADNADDIITLP